MGLGGERDLVPLGTGFDIVKRGYDKGQVEEHLERLDADLRLIIADRDAAVSQSADLARQLERARSELDDLRGQVQRLSLPPTTLEGLSERLQRMLRLAQEESNEIKARAEADAGQIRGRAEADATALRTRYEKLIAEVEGRRVELETEHTELVAKSEAEFQAKEKAAADARAKLDAESAARRSQIEDDFEIAMSARRAEAMRALAEQEATSKAEAERRVREATDEAARVRAQVAQEAQASKAESERVHREVTEEAARVRAQIAEETRVSKADAEKRVRDATEDANRRHHESVTEAKARLQDAADQANNIVREATEEANRRMAHATGRVEELRRLRAQIAEQLRSAHVLITNAAPALDALPEEAAISDTGSSSGPSDPPSGAAEKSAAGATTPDAAAKSTQSGATQPAGSPIPNAQPAKPSTPVSGGQQGAANAPTKRVSPVAPPPGKPGLTPNRPAQGVRR